MKPGVLRIVATPLGNLDDLSPRAVEILRGAALIACEDTRRTARLCERFGIDTPRVSCHRFNERERMDRVLGPLAEGRDVALVSDAGTPGIRDPGRRVVDEAWIRGYAVSPVPGGHAPSALLSASGFDGDRYVFEGFLPARSGERRRRLRELASETRTVVAFETPHRLRAALADLAEILGDRRLAIGRELTKVHESIDRGTAAELGARLPEPLRGEITLAWEGASAAGSAERDADDERLREDWERALAREDGDRRRAIKRLARDRDLGRAELKRLLDERELG